MLKIDVKKLRKITNSVQEELSAENEKKQEALREEVRKQREQDKVKADKILAKLPAKAEAAARRGKFYVEVMKCQTIIPDGAEEIVFEKCKKLNLSPYVEAWDDGIGIRGGYKMYIKWN